MRTTLIEERCYDPRHPRNNNNNKLKPVIKRKSSLAPFLPNDLIFKIFLVLPIKTLLKITCVCKSWKKIINCAQFVDSYNKKAQTCAIYLRPIEPDRLLDISFNIETEVSKLESLYISCFDSWKCQRAKVISFLEIEDGKGKFVDLNISCLGSIVAICNGLILISSYVSGNPRFGRGRLIIMNPITRKFLGFPLGTHPHCCFHNESYGLMFSHLEGVYKVVHLFKDELRNIFCEVWSTDTRYWRAIDCPPQTVSHFNGCSEIPIWASGALNWVPSRYKRQFVLSMGADDERFFMTKLPTSLGQSDKLLERGGVLSFLRSLDSSSIEVWMLKGLDVGSEWIKQHTIRIQMDAVEANDNFVPVFAVNAKERIFRRREKLYSYDFDAEEMTEIQTGDMKLYENLRPFTSDLASWERLEPML